MGEYNDVLSKEENILIEDLNILRIALREEQISFVIKVKAFGIGFVGEIANVRDSGLPVIVLQILFNCAGRVKEGAALHKVPDAVVIKFEIPGHMAVTVIHFLRVG